MAAHTSTALSINPVLAHWVYHSPPNFSNDLSHSVLICPVPHWIHDSHFRTDLERYGVVKDVETISCTNGIKLVHYYDSRAAFTLCNAIRNHHRTLDNSTPPPLLLVRNPLWAHLVISHFENQATLVVLNNLLPSTILTPLFESYGDIKSVTSASWKKRNPCFIEFFDLRDASNAFDGLNGKEVLGEQLNVEFSRSKFSYDNFGVMGGYVGNNFWREMGYDPFNLMGEHGGASVSSLEGNQRENYETHQFDASKTTLMIKNIPNKYSLKLLMSMLDEHCLQSNKDIGDGEPSSYDFLYLPISFRNDRNNLSYAFVNMTSAEAAQRLYLAFHNKHWEHFNSTKLCDFSYATVQGLEALQRHFKDKLDRMMDKRYLPVVFSPPRDGRQLTDPIPIKGNMLLIGKVWVNCDLST